MCYSDAGEVGRHSVTHTQLAQCTNVGAPHVSFCQLCCRAARLLPLALPLQLGGPAVEVGGRAGTALRQAEAPAAVQAHDMKTISHPRASQQHGA